MNIDEKMKDTLWQLATTLRDNAAKKYDATDARYRQLVEAACEAYTAYTALALDERQRVCIDDVLECRQEVNEYQLTMIYLAGLLDGIDFLREGGFLDLYIMDDQIKKTGVEWTAERHPEQNNKSIVYDFRVGEKELEWAKSHVEEMSDKQVLEAARHIDQCKEAENKMDKDVLRKMVVPLVTQYAHRQGGKVELVDADAEAFSVVLQMRSGVCYGCQDYGIRTVFTLASWVDISVVQGQDLRIEMTFRPTD